MNDGVKPGSLDKVIEQLSLIDWANLHEDVIQEIRNIEVVDEYEITDDE